MGFELQLNEKSKSRQNEEELKALLTEMEVIDFNVTLEPSWSPTREQLVAEVLGLLKRFNEDKKNGALVPCNDRL